MLEYIVLEYTLVCFTYVHICRNNNHNAERTQFNRLLYKCFMVTLMEVYAI